MQPQLLVLGILLLLVGVAPVWGKKRARVRVFGATVGSNFVRKEGQRALNCPASHGSALDLGRTCCSRTVSNGVGVTGALDFYLPLQLCNPEDRLVCPYLPRKCKSRRLATDPCPTHHAYAADRGTYCCRYPRKIVNASISARCDGGMLVSNDPKECCPKEDYVLCRNGTRLCYTEQHCPMDFSFTRAGHYGMRYMGVVTHLSITPASCPIGSKMLDFRDHDFKQEIGTLMGELPTVHAGLMDYTPGGTLCSMATCAGVRTWMSDNATLVWKLWMNSHFVEFAGNLTFTCHKYIYDQWAPGGRLTPDRCTNGRRLICVTPDCDWPAPGT